MNPSGSPALYQAAIVLIPLLLFSSAIGEVAERRRRAEEKNAAANGVRRRIVIAVILFLSLIGGMVALLIAIRGAIDPSSVHELGQRFLVGMMALGTAGVTILAASPLLERGSDLLARVEQILVGVLLGFAVLASQLFVGQSLEAATVREEVEVASSRQLETSRALQSAEEHNLIARQQLIRFARQSQEPRGATDYADHLIREFDHARAVMEEGFNADNVLARMDRGYAILSNLTGDLGQDLDGALPEIEGAGRQLYLLAERRLSTAMGVVMSSAANAMVAQIRSEEVCGEPEPGLPISCP